jgi:glutaredoxin
MDRRKIHRTKYLAVFATTTLIFLIGLLVGNQITNIKLEKINDLEQDLKVDTMAVELQYLLLAEDPCSYINSTLLTEELYNIGSRLDYMENQMGNKNPSVLHIKEYYSLLELRHWLYMRKVNNECGVEYPLLLYFYSNLGDCPSCQEQGYVLNYLHRKYPSLNIYSFDINIENTALDTIKKIYKVESTPAIVINDDAYFGFKDRDELEKLLS